MSDKERRLRLLTYVFAAVVVVSAGLIMMNFIDYIGLLTSMNKVTVTIDEMVHYPEGDKVNIALTFSVENPTTYTRLKFSSIQCQLYIITGGGEEYVGVAAYAPPVDIPLKPFEERTFTTSIAVPRSNIERLSDSIESDLEWRIRSVIHFSTPIRKYYQNVNFHPVSAYKSSIS